MIDVPTEQTTAATDVLLSVVAVALMVYLHRFRRLDPWKVAVWSWVAGLLALGAALGSVVHGVRFSPATTRVLWQPLYLSLAFVVILVVVGAITDWRGRQTARRFLPGLVVFPVLFWVVTFIGEFSYAAFVIFELPAMAFALGVYLKLAVGRSFTGAWWMVAAIFLTIAAAAVQATGVVYVTVVWPFDHNGVFHLVQILAVGVLAIGLRLSFTSKMPGEHP
ncbi:MAG: hypothetical protein JSW58_01875 [Candidatus Latescibacterota bacterium]|nr:MAG: hypothetical protein JSW58_01875 [Candidatus Latescibacterota bacterium]